MQIPCGVARRKRDREGSEPAEPTQALRATPPERELYTMLPNNSFLMNGVDRN